MLEHTQMLRTKKLKGGGIIALAARHNLREIQAENGAGSHIDPRRTSQNIILRGAGCAADIAAEANNLMELAKIKPLRKDAVRGLEILFSLPPSTGIAERDYFSAAALWAGEYFEVPILSAVIHNDEAAPHCHVILLPLFNGRMLGSALIGNKARLLAMQTDFHLKVAQGYGLKRATPAKRYSGAARASAADRIVSALRSAPNSLDDPAIRDALRDAIAETMPVCLMAALKLEMPEAKTPKPKTFVSIMTKKFKPEKPIGFQRKKPIEFDADSDSTNKQSLSCVGFAISQLPADEYIRERETEQSADYWDENLGEFIKPPTSQLKSAKQGGV